MRRVTRLLSWWIALTAAVCLLALPAAAEDLYREPVCLGLDADREANPGTTLVKLLRWPFALEQPFHVLADDPFEETQELNGSTRVLFHGHSGVILEGPAASPWNTDLELQAGFSRGPSPGSPLCEGGMEFGVPEARITTDPYTGNLFVGRFEDDRLHLAIFDPSGHALVELRSDLFFRSPLTDLTGTPRAQIDPTQTPGYFWFAPRRLAGFVDVYRRLGGSSYARFLVDAFLSEMLLRDRAGDEDSAGPRLPYLPGPDPGTLMPKEIENLRGLRTTYRQVFIRGRPRKGGVSCALMPVLKMLEDRDCRNDIEAGRSPAKNSCPTYSAMALQTELFREYPETMRHRGYALHQVFETLVKRGLCPESRYPMLTDVAMGRTRSVEQFGARAEKELNRILDAPAPDLAAGLEPLPARTDPGPMRFVEQLPPLCLDEMAAYREARALAPHDLVDLLATQDWFDDVLTREQTSELVRAQKQELFRLVVRLLRGGMLVGVAGDRGNLEQHAVLAYGWNAEGVLLMDSDLPTEAARRRTLISAEELQRSLSGVTFLRTEVEGVPPTAEQLSASLTVLPDIAWTHVRLAKLYQQQGRHRDAVRHLQRVVELDPGRANSWLTLGESLQVLGRFEEALEATRKAMAAGLNGRYAKAQLGYSLRKLGRLEEAEQAFRAAVNSEYSWEWRQLGWTLFDLGRDDEAEECFRQAREIEPGWILNHVRLAEFLYYSGNPGEAVETLRSATQADFDSADRIWIGNWLGFLDRHDEAILLLESVLTQEPDSRAARLALARIYHRQGETGKAAAVVAPLVHDLAPPTADGTADRGEQIDLAYAQALSDAPDACRSTVAAVHRHYDELESATLYDLACIQALNGDTDSALKSLEAAFQRGFDDYRWARRDPDLASLFGQPRLQQIFETYGSHER